MKQANTKQVVITVIAVVLASAAGKFGVDYFMRGNASFDRALMETASEINKNCPIMVDQHTRLDNTITLPGNVFQYNYTLVNHSRDEIDVEQVKNGIRPSILNSIKSNDQMSAFRSNKVTMNYSYKDKNGIALFTLVFTPADYGEQESFIRQ